MEVFGLAQACTGLPDLVDRSSQVSEVSVLRVPVYQNWTDRSSIVREGKIGACAGLPDLVDRSSKVSQVEILACTGLPKMGDRSTQSSEMDFFASIGLPKMGDRSTPVKRFFCEACTGLRKSRRPVYACKFAKFIKGNSEICPNPI